MNDYDILCTWGEGLRGDALVYRYEYQALLESATILKTGPGCFGGDSGRSTPDLLTLSLMLSDTCSLWRWIWRAPAFENQEQTTRKLLKAVEEFSTQSRLHSELRRALPQR